MRIRETQNHRVKMVRIDSIMSNNSIGTQRSIKTMWKPEIPKCLLQNACGGGGEKRCEKCVIIFEESELFS